MSTLQSAVSITGELLNANDFNEYTVDLRAGENYEFHVAGESSTGDGTFISNPMLSLVGFGEFESDNDGGLGTDAAIHFTPSVSGTYLLSVQGLGGDAGKYNLSVTNQSIDTDILDNAGNDLGHMRIASNDILISRIDTAADGDLVEVDLGIGNYVFEARGSSSGDGTLSDPFIEVFDAAGHRVALDDDSGAGANARATFHSTQPGIYYVRVTGFGAHTGSYELEVKIGDGTGDVVPSGVANTDVTIVPGSTIIGHIDPITPGADHDTYRIELTKGVLYEFDLSSSSNGGAALPDPKLQLHRLDGSLVTFDDDSGGNLNAKIIFEAPETGFFFLRCGSFEGASVALGRYALSAKVLSAVPSGPLVTIGSEQDSSHHDTITGSSGSEQLSGSAGDDTMDGGAGNDTLDYSGVLAPVNVNLVTGIASGPDIGFDKVSNFENVLGGAGADQVTGTSAANVLKGNGGNDQLVGGAGADVLEGGADNDLLDGGTENDKLTGGDGKDTLDGGAGNDTMTGGAGDDFYDVDAGNDVVIEAANGGIDTVITDLSRVLESNVENLTLSGVGDVNGTGNALANNIFGSFGINLLIGGGGNDTMNGFFGDDTLIGGAGKDLLVGGSGDDEFRFNALSESGVAGSKRDVIDGFAHGDKIDVTGIDANSALAGNQAFTFHTNFTGHAGELQFDQLAANKLLVSGDVNGDAKADFAVVVVTEPGFGALLGSDFIL